MEPTIDLLEEIEENVALRAFLYDDPDTYREAVEAAFAAVRTALQPSGAGV